MKFALAFSLVMAAPLFAQKPGEDIHGRVFVTPTVDGNYRIERLDTKHCPCCSSERIEWWPEGWSCEACRMGGDIADMTVSPERFDRNAKRTEQKQKSKAAEISKRLKKIAELRAAIKEIEEEIEAL